MDCFWFGLVWFGLSTLISLFCTIIISTLCWRDNVLNIVNEQLSLGSHFIISRLGHLEQWKSSHRSPQLPT
jgi:hypothetical protein